MSNGKNKLQYITKCTSIFSFVKTQRCCVYTDIYGATKWKIFIR